MYAVENTFPSINCLFLYLFMILKVKIYNVEIMHVVLDVFIFLGRCFMWYCWSELYQTVNVVYMYVNLSRIFQLLSRLGKCFFYCF